MHVLHFRGEGCIRKTERGSDLPKLTQLLIARVKTLSQVLLFPHVVISASICLACLEQLLRWDGVSIKISNVPMSQPYSLFSWDECIHKDVWIPICPKILEDSLTELRQFTLIPTLKSGSLVVLFQHYISFPYFLFLPFHCSLVILKISISFSPILSPSDFHCLPLCLAFQMHSLCNLPWIHE